MFTGLVESVGTVVEAAGDSPRRLTIESEIDPREVSLGDSVALDGCCLTVVDRGTATLSFEAATETIARTTLGDFTEGRRVNLERALRLGDRLGGHLVAGHVDAVGRIEFVEQRGSARYVGIRPPNEIALYIASQGSITVAGVSLTVTAVGDDDVFWVGLIPHTLDVTTLGTVAVGDSVNLEVDLIARYLHRLMRKGQLAQAPSAADAGLTMQFLEDKGFL